MLITKIEGGKEMCTWAKGEMRNRLIDNLKKKKKGRKGGSAYSGVEKIGTAGEEEKKEEISQNYEGELYLLYCF
jgi:hypothetical protein